MRLPFFCGHPYLESTTILSDVCVCRVFWPPLSIIIFHYYSANIYMHSPSSCRRLSLFRPRPAPLSNFSRKCLVCVCMYVCVYMCVYVCICVCICVYIYVCVYCICMCVYMMYIDVCVYRCACIFVYICMCISVCVYICVRAYVCVYMYVRMCVCIYIHTYIYIVCVYIYHQLEL